MENEKVQVGLGSFRAHQAPFDEPTVLMLGEWPPAQEQEGPPQPILWTVVASEGARALVLSHSVIDCVAYDDLERKGDGRAPAWPGCGLRKWMNVDFLEGAFSESERAKIVAYRHVDAPPAPFREEEPVTDLVFALSSEEFRRYLEPPPGGGAPSPALFARPTPHALERGVLHCDGGAMPDGRGFPAGCHWWLRDQGRKGRLRAAYVRSSGRLVEDGRLASSGGIGVRPALLLDLA